MSSPKYKQFLQHQDLFKRFIGRKLDGASTIDDITFSQHADDILVFLSTPVLGDDEQTTGDEETTWSFFKDIPKSPSPVYKNLAKVRNKVLFNSRLPESKQMKPQAKKLTVEHLKRIIKEEVDAFVKESNPFVREREQQESEKKVGPSSAEKRPERSKEECRVDRALGLKEEPVAQPVVAEDSNIIAQDEEGVLAFESVAETRARKTKALKEAKIAKLRKVIREMIQREKAQKSKVVVKKK